MHFSRSRYVTVCQQLLAAATVTAVGLTAAGVMTLDIVGPEAAGPVTAGQGLSRDLRSAVHVRSGYVDTRPVTPKVREVRLTDAPTSGTTGSTPSASEPTSPDRSGSAGEGADGDRGVRPRLASAPNDADRKAPETLEGMPVAVLSPPEKVSGYATVGVTWSPQVHLGEDQIALQVRTLRDGHWSAWQALEYHDDHAPDPGDASDDGSRPGTDPSVVGHVDAVQMRAATATGKAPADIRLALVDPGEGHLVEQAPAIDTAKIPTSDDTATGTDPVESTGPDTSTQGDVALRAMKVAPKPKIYSRAQWGANEHIREQSKPDYGTIKTGFVHHTVNANDYTRKQVPSIIRGIYAYHVEGRGWRDIGYNFLVDRFGRIWEGRWGGVNRPVVGAHTYGYNDVSFAMSAIGNYDIKRPSKAIINAYARLFAWKLSKYGIRANAKGLRIRGTTLHAINGHRDVSATACPGRYLYAKLPQIRKKARQIQKAAQDGSTPPSTGPTEPTRMSPTRTPVAARDQPLDRMDFKQSSNLAGSDWPDIALLDRDNRVFVLRTGGMVGFEPSVKTSGWSGLRNIVAVGDVTGDGVGDVMAQVPGKHGWRIHAGQRDGHVPVTASRDRRWFTNCDLLFGVGDWNGDGNDDVMARDRRARTGHALFLYPGNGDGTFRKRVKLATDWNRFVRTVLAGDLNSDGRPDLVAWGNDGRLYKVFGASKHRIGEPKGARRLGTFGKKYDAIAGGGDQNGDGIGDILLRRTRDGGGLILPGDGHGGFRHSLGPLPRLAALGQISGASITGSGRPDIVGRTRGGVLRVIPNNGRVNVEGTTSAQRKFTNTHAIYDVGDWNNDGRPDLVALTGKPNDPNTLRLHLGDGRGHFGKGLLMSRGWKAIRDLSPVGDVTGDDHPDLMGRNADGTMLIFRSDGARNIKAPRVAAESMRTYNQIGSDMWQSGRLPDSVVGSSDGSFVPVGGQGVEADSAMRQAGNGRASRYDWVIGAGDVDGDGHADLIVRAHGSGALWLIPGTRHGFGHRVFLAGGFGSYRLGG